MVINETKCLELNPSNRGELKTQQRLKGGDAKTCLKQNKSKINSSLEETKEFLKVIKLNHDQISKGLLFYAYVEVHQVRRLVFDNYQWCLVSLKD